MLTHGVATPFREFHGRTLKQHSGKAGARLPAEQVVYYCESISQGQGGKMAESFLPDNRKVRLSIMEWLRSNNRLHRINRHLSCPRKLASLKRERHIVTDAEETVGLSFC